VSEEGGPHRPEEVGWAADESDEGTPRERVAEREASRGRFYIHSWTSFLGKAATLQRDGRRRTTSPGKIRIDFDFLPAWEDLEHEVTFFVLAEDSMSVWTKHWEQATRKAGPPYLKGGEWQHQGVFASPFIEPFHLAAVADGAYFLVTDECGEVYVAEEENAQWNSRAVWKDAARPVVAMLTNADGSAPFVFGKDFYFQLAREIHPKPCKDITQGRPDLGDPMRTVLECAKVLHKAGMLNDTKRPE
jgi:hypothetical protein